MIGTAKRRQRVETLRVDAAAAMDLARAGDTSSSAQSIALSLATLVGINADEAYDSWERDREREKAFGAELERLATGEGTKLLPADRTKCLSLLAQWISEGYDKPPSLADYEDAMRRTRGR